MAAYAYIVLKYTSTLCGYTNMCLTKMKTEFGIASPIIHILFEMIKYLLECKTC